MFWILRGLKFGVLSLALAGIAVMLTACSSGGNATATPTPGAVPTSTPVSPSPTAVVATPSLTTAPSATSTPNPSETPLYGGVVRYASAMDIDTLDPAYTIQYYTYPILYALYDPIFRVDPQGKLLPGLAKSWDISADGKSITLHLQNGVKFQDGTPFSADSIKWNLQRILDPNSNSPYTSVLARVLSNINVVDDSTITLQFSQPFRPILAEFASEREGFIASPTAVQKYGSGINGGFGKNPVGTGPFSFQEWVINDYVTLVKNKDYWQPGKPYLDGITFQAIADNTVRVAMVRTGESDIIDNATITGFDIPTLERNSNLRLPELPGTTTWFMHLNPSKPPFDNKDLRQAMSYAINRTNYVSGLLGGLGSPAYTFIAAGWAYNPDLKPISYDLQKAKEKLTEAGYPNGITLHVACPDSLMSRCEVPQALLKDAGINLDITTRDIAGYYSMTNTGYFYQSGFGVPNWFYRIDPDTNLRRAFYSKGLNNLGAYNNPEVDKLLDEAAATYDVAQAKPLYDQVQTTIAEDAPVIVLASGTAVFPMNKNLEGFAPYPTRFEHLEFTWLAK